MTSGTALSDLIVQRVGLENISRNSALGRMVQRRGVSMTLWPVQAAALRDVHDYRGALLPLGVGMGKALVSLLAPVVLEAKRPVLFVPADLREQTNRYVMPAMTAHWRLHPELMVIGYSELSLAKNSRMLERLQPDLIVLDECHAVKNRTAGRTRRLVRYMKAHPETMVVAMSGTISNRSIKDYWHILHWALKDVLTPLPLNYREVEDWALAVDEKVPDEKRVAPGAMLRFLPEAEQDAIAQDGRSMTVDEARRAYRMRLVETPGVVATGEHELGTALRIHRLRLSMPPDIRKAMDVLERSWKTPNGDYVSEAVDLWRHARELALGFYYRWKYPAPQDWLDARKEWKRFVRDTLKHNKTLDTELQVARACDIGDLPSVERREWLAVKDMFKPETEPEWLSDYAIEDCLRWADKERGIVWVEHVAFGLRLRDRGLRYYGAGKEASAAILEAEGPIAASIRSHGQGKNLQQWCENLVTAPPTSGKTWEQVLGRTHRFGQEADEVRFGVYQYAGGQIESFEQARADAKYLESTLGARQKLNYADIV